MHLGVKLVKHELTNPSFQHRSNEILIQVDRRDSVAYDGVEDKNGGLEYSRVRSSKDVVKVEVEKIR